jgi:DNA-binding response OmpR family regulator
LRLPALDTRHSSREGTDGLKNGLAEFGIGLEKCLRQFSAKGEIMSPVTDFPNAGSDSGPRIAVIDDERRLREILELGLTHHGFAVRTAADGALGLTLVREWEPHAIVLDVMLPKVDGLTLLPMLRRVTEAPILMLSAKGELDDKLRGLSSGADDYLAKPFEMPELVARLRTALRRPALDHPDFLTFGDLTIDLRSHVVTRAGTALDLSAKEFALLVVLARHPRQVITREQLFDRVWGADSAVELATVERYVSYVRAKVDGNFTARLIHTVRGVGYTLRFEDEGT